MPRATTAAWEVMPPKTVRIPCEKSMPSMSSGVVSRRTRMTFCLVLAMLGSLIGGEIDAAGGSAGGGGQTLGDDGWQP